MPEQRTGRICPQCKSARVHRSSSHSLKEKLVRIAGARKRRCHECGFDYFQLGWSVLSMRDLDHAARRLTRYAAALLAVALLLLAIRRIVIRLAEPGPSGTTGRGGRQSSFSS